MNKSTLKYLFTLLTVFEFHSVTAQLQPIGLWRDHLPYHSASHIVRGNQMIYAATPYSIFSIDPSDNSTMRYSRINGLSQTGVSDIAFNGNIDKLIIAYHNSDFDVLHNGLIKNIPDFMLDNITGDKTVYDILPYENDFYLSTGIGIVIVNGSKDEIRSTWIIGNGGSKIRINSVATHNGIFYAATVEGLKRVLPNTDAADHNNWNTLSGANGLPSGAAEKVIVTNDTIIALIRDSLFYSTGSNWTYLFSEAGWKIRNIESEQRGLMLFMKSATSAKVIIGNLLQPTQISDPTIVHIPEDGIAAGDIWIADSVKGVSRISSTSVTHFDLNSPQSIATGQLITINGELYAASGGTSEHWQPLNNDNGIYRYSNGTWTNINRYNGAPAHLIDVISLAHAGNNTIWAGTFGNGLVQIQNNNHIFYAAGSAISQSIVSPGSYRVTGVAFDPAKNLWISNHGAALPVVVRKSDGSWKQIGVPFPIAGNAVSQIVIDKLDIKWIISPGNGVIAFNENNTIDDISDDKWRLLKTGMGAGNLPGPNVSSIALDKDGIVWIGTDNGIALIECGQQIFSNSCEAVLPVVNVGGVNNYLFRGERVHAIAIDGANRKWIGTDNGAWLISAGGDKTIYHFTRSNSALLNDTVRAITVEGSSGEVYFGTNSGLISFRGTATDATDKNDLLIFPNPVPAGYNGTIAIKGLVGNSIVKIVDPDGRLVYHTRALGGQAVWDGRNYKGQRISSGVYVVLVTDEQRKEKASGRIIFIHTQQP